MIEEDLKTPQRKYSARMRRFTENITGYLFVFPALLIIFVFGLFPIGYSIYMSTFQWRVRKGDFIGIENYSKIIGDWTGLVIFIAGIGLLILAYLLWINASKAKSNYVKIIKFFAAILLLAFGFVISIGWDKMILLGDEGFLNSLIITVFYALGSVPLQLIIALILAYILFQNIKGKELFRMIFFLPYVTPVVTTAVVFRIIFSPRETSLANILIGRLGIEPLKWLFEPKAISELMFGLKDLNGLLAGPSLALLTIILFGVWTFVGYNTVIFLAGLGGIPKEVYEAAEMDGANSWDLFRFVTVPLLSPITFYLFLISFIGTFKAFNHIYVMKVPNAQKTVVTASVQIFQTFYTENNFSVAATEAIILFLIILGLTFAQNKLLGDRVFYG
ncbi:MAG: carbohydrate ABC transporter permease [Anaerolineaceae bacterium]